MATARDAHFRLGVSEKDEIRCQCSFSNVDQSRMDAHYQRHFYGRSHASVSHCPHKRTSLKGGYWYVRACTVK